MTKRRSKADKTPCLWLNEREAFKAFATHEGKTQSARHIKPLHWYIACRLVLEGGFRPDDITPRPPFRVEERRGPKGRPRYLLHHDASLGGFGEQIVLGGLKTKNVDVVVNRNTIGPVLAVSCKGVTKAFRNLSNRMEETIGECTNLHITYPAMVVGYFAILRANRTVQDVLDAPDLDDDDTATEIDPEEDDQPEEPALPTRAAETLKRNDIALLEGNVVVEGIHRFHAALCEMTARRGLRDEISRYESMSIALVEPRGETSGTVFPDFPPLESPLRLDLFFQTLYQRYEERFVYGAPLLAERGITTRLEWDPESPALAPGGAELGFIPRLAYVIAP